MPCEAQKSPINAAKKRKTELAAMTAANGRLLLLLQFL